MAWPNPKWSKTLRPGNSNTYNPILKWKLPPLLRSNYILSIAQGVFIISLSSLVTIWAWCYYPQFNRWENWGSQWDKPCEKYYLEYCTYIFKKSGYSCFTMLCEFLLYNEVDPLYVYIHPLPLGKSRKELSWLDGGITEMWPIKILEIGLRGK